VPPTTEFSKKSLLLEFDMETTLTLIP
jgi:hypothetical protein